MTASHPPSWIPSERIGELVQLEPALFIVGLGLIAWILYKGFLRQVSEERHRNLKRHFRDLAFHLCMSSLFVLAYLGLQGWDGTAEFPVLARLNPYLGLVALLFGGISFVKISRIFLFEYLFLSHMTVAVPLLLVNLFTLILSILILGWAATEIFHVSLAPVLATSAIFSLVLGLALQDTLGNLFAGVALQFDKPFELGDWIEVHDPGGTAKWVGQVYEISWRATVLIAFSEELITIPNRVMAQAEVSNYATRFRPVIRSQVFRFPHEEVPEAIRPLLVRAAKEVPGIRHNPAPFVLLIESAESWVVYKLIYYVDQFGSQYVIGDKVIDACLRELREAGIRVASPRLSVAREGAAPGRDLPPIS